MVVNIKIPDDCHCVLQPGQKINLGDPFLEKKIDQYLELNISKELVIEPKKIFQYLKKFVGDEVKKDEVIAQKKNLFSQKKYHSPVSGVIKEVDHQLGSVIVTISKKEKTKIKAYFNGEIINLTKTDFDLDLGKGESFDIKPFKFNFGGETLYPDENTFQQLTSVDIDQKVIIIKNATNLTQSKMEVLGAVGLVSLNQPDELDDLYSTQIKNEEDFQKIITKKYRYCLVDNHSGKIYFYELKKNN